MYKPNSLFEAAASVLKEKKEVLMLVQYKHPDYRITYYTKTKKTIRSYKEEPAKKFSRAAADKFLSQDDPYRDYVAVPWTTEKIKI